MKQLTSLFIRFYNSEKTAGILLIGVTLISMILSNTVYQQSYIQFWEIEIGGETIVHWINDGLMTIFFLLIGLELEREIYKGELSDFKSALFPLMAAVGGLLLPAGIFLLFNFGTPTQGGAGIPMATDIAFAIAILSILGKRVPNSLKIFLTALAVSDDLGAILVIAFFYSKGIVVLNLMISIGIFLGLLVLNKLKINSMIPYLLGGAIMWYFMHQSGIHATIIGVLLAFAIPIGRGDATSPSDTLEHVLQKPVAFFILPLFALANTCLVFDPGWEDGLIQRNGLGILVGLIVGKPLGIFICAYLAVKTGLCKLPDDLKWKHIISVGCLGGIGFTMSIFITLLAYDSVLLINQSKITVLIASVCSGMLGLLFLYMTLAKPNLKNDPV
jgi:Na+:H+ antiporter, NhaA family